ncbi:MAG TPA: arsenate reductase ArsC [Luteibacter sp.]|jgi:arsenate reductase|uniref:arsenate reductase ArsC n=1 Tax=Luteibacter sp. TaxID=1886636 RepID=UPI002F3EC39B
MSDRVLNVLFLCTHNSARSVLAESILRQDGAGRFRAFSAGSSPRSSINPMAVQVLDELGYPTAKLASKSWDVFEAEGAPTMDIVITVCDNAAGEVCPIWPGRPVTAHWGIEDPSVAEGTELDRKRAFLTAFRYLKNRISALIALPADRLDALSLRDELKKIGRSAGASPRSLDAT